MADRRLAAAAVAVAAVALCGGCSTRLTPPVVAGSVTATFDRLYADQQQLLGRPAVQPGYTSTSCRRTSTAGAGAGGAGDDWVCVVQFQASDGTLVAASYDMTVKTDGCYTATGPAALVGPATLTTPSGTGAVNPLYEFDGCFDPG